MKNSRLPFVVWMLALAGCDVLQEHRFCEPIDETQAAQLPERLSQTGLFSDMATETLAPGVFPFAPRFEFWSDGAVKRRWIYLPPGTQIDTSQMDAWQFPQGTKVWKEFSRGGVRVETRLLQKVGPGPEDWVPMAYLWNDSRTDANAVADGVIDALGTQHNVPAATECMGCHGGRESRLLGFSAIQLSHAGPPGGLNLRELTRRNLLSAPPPGDFVVPGDERAKAALGYLHANCSHCHNQNRPQGDGLRCFDPRNTIDFSLRVEDLGSVEQTATYRTAIGSVVERGNPSGSEVIRRASSRGGIETSMPPLGTEDVDNHGISLLQAWIEQL